MNNYLDKILEEHSVAINAIRSFSDEIENIANNITNVIRNGGKVLFCGNGGSAADSQHLATEFVVRFRSELMRKALPAIALTTDTSMITAGANDFGFDTIFSRQIEGLGKEGDYLVGISTSGNSVNVLKAIEKAKKMGIKTLLLGGKDGGRIKSIADQSLIIPSNNTARIQEAHITIGHILCLRVEEIIFNNK